MGDPTRRTIRLDDLIFKATDGLLIGPDYAAIMQICDVLNNRKERVPLAVGVFKERLKHREKDVVLRTLELLDAVTKNVPESVQYVGSKDFLSVLRKMVTNKKTEFLVKETLLAYLQSCALAFKRKSGTHFQEVYDALRKEGVSFPPPEKEAERLFRGSSPAHSPKVAAASQQQRQTSGPTGWWGSKPDEGSRSLETPPTAGRKPRTQEHHAGRGGAGQEEKLLLAFSSAGVAGLEQELSLLQNSIELAEDILRNAHSKLDIQSDDVLRQVLSSCRSAQSQVQSLLAVPSPPMTEDMVAALLYANDRLLAVQSRHQALLTGERVAHTQTVSSDESSSSSSSDDDDDDDDEGNGQYGGVGGQSSTVDQRRTTEAADMIPQLLRGPPRVRNQPLQQQHAAVGYSPASLLHAPAPRQSSSSSSSEDILDEFAALALRHASTPVAASTPAALPPQPYPMGFPYPAATVLAPSQSSPPGGAGGSDATNPFILASPLPYLSTTATSPPTYSPASSIPYYHLPPPLVSASSAPAVQAPYHPQPQASPYAHFFSPAPLPSGWGTQPAPQPAPPASSSIQDDFDLLFGKRQ